MPDDQVQVITDEQGTEHHFPKEATPEMIAKALNVKPPQAIDLKTGQGMEAQAQAQSQRFFTGSGGQGKYDATGRQISGLNDEPLTLMEKAAQEQSDRQTRLGALQNRASPTPFTNAAIPILGATGVGGSIVKQGLKATAKPIVKGVVGAVGGSAAGSYGGREVGKIFGNPDAGAKIGGVLGGLAGILMGRMGEEPPPEVFPVSKSPGPYRGPASVPKIKPSPPFPFPGATPSSTPIGEAELPSITQGSPTPFPTVQPKVPTGGAAKPFEPLVYESEAQANQIAQRNANLKRQASAAGTYHAAQGSASKPTNLQQRIGRKLPWLSEEDQ